VNDNCFPTNDPGEDTETGHACARKCQILGFPTNDPGEDTETGWGVQVGAGVQGFPTNDPGEDTETYSEFVEKVGAAKFSN
jgi:hypothetical protein